MAITVTIMLSLVVLGILIVDVKRTSTIDFTRIFFITAIIIFGVIPIFLIWNPQFLLLAGANWGTKYVDTLDYAPHTAILTLVFFTVLIGVFSVAVNKNYTNLDGGLASISRFLEANACTLGVAFSLIGAAAFLMYSTAAGGPVNAIINAQAIRSGHIQETGSLTFFKHFMRIAYLGSFFLFANACRQKRIDCYLVFLLSFFSSLIVMWTYAGRAGAVVFLGVFILSGMYKRKITLNTWLVGFAFIIVGLGLIAYLRPFLLLVGGAEDAFESIDKSTQTYVLEKLISGFSTGNVSLQVSVASLGFDDLYFGRGFGLSFTELLPKRLLGFDNFQTINSSHTELYGYIQDERGYTITAGLITYLFFEFWVPGIVFGGAIIGLVLGCISRIDKKVPKKGVLHLLFLFYALKVPAYLINSDPASLIKAEFPFICCFFLIMFIFKFRKTCFVYYAGKEREML